MLTALLRPSVCLTQVLTQRIRQDKRALVSELDAPPDEPTFPLVTKKLPGQTLPPVSGAAHTGSSIRSSSGKGAAPRPVPPAAAATVNPGGPGRPLPPGKALEYSVNYMGRPVTEVVLTAQLPPGFSCSALFATATGSGGDAGARSSVSDQASGMLNSDLSIEVADRDVYVHAVPCEKLHVRLPFAVTHHGADARVSSDGQLQLRLPYLPLGELAARMRAEAPHTFGSLALGNRSYLELEV